MWDLRKGREEHKCPINHEGSAAAIEATGILRIYEQSIKLNIRYMTYIEDGDSVVKTQPLDQIKSPTKGQCIGHVQKRLGARLRKFKKEHGKEILLNSKKLG